MSYGFKDINKYGVIKIPDHWDLTTLSRVAEVIDPEPSHRAPEIAKGEGFPYVGIRDINPDGTVNVETARPIEEESLIEQENRFKIEPSDIVFCRVATLGLPKILKTDKRIALSATVALIKSKKSIDNQYLLFFLESNVINVQTALYATGSTRKSLGMETIRKFNVFLPPYEEQVKIAEYLKCKLEVIDSLIGDKNSIISLLEEKRQSMITEAVTKGLNPNVKMKDSGVEWIGNIPEHWEKTRLDFVARVKARLGWKGLKAEEYVDEGYIFLSTPNLKGRNIEFYNVNYITEERYLESPEIMLENGDVLLAKDGSTLGTTNVVRKLPAKSTVNSSIAVLRPKEMIDSIYFYYYLSSTYIQNIINQIKDGMGVPHLFQADIKKFLIILPPLSEQKEIANYLDKQIETLDSLIETIKVQIKKLRDYRQSLIYEAVTGKINVRELEVVS